MSSYNSPTTTPNFDNLLLQSLLNRLNLRPPTTTTSTTSQPPSSTSFEDFLSSHLSSFLSSSSDDDDDSSSPSSPTSTGVPTKTRLAKEETRLEKEIIKVILTGKTDSLKPNSGQAVAIGDHHVCVGFHEEDGGSEYRVWEWHGHIMLFDDDHGYTPEYIYGNYFERLVGGAARKKKKEERENGKREEVKVVEKEREEKEESLSGLKELIAKDDHDGGGGNRVLHRARNAGSLTQGS